MKLLTLFTITLLLAGCGGGGSSFDSAPSAPREASYKITHNNSVETIQNVTHTTLHLDLGTAAKSLYVVTTSSFDNQTISVNSSAIATSQAREIEGSSNRSYRRIAKSTIEQHILKFNKNAFKLLRNSNYQKSNTQLSKKSRTINTITQGSSQSFCVDMNNYSYECTQTIQATAKKIVKEVQTPQGTKSLIIWVANNANISNQAIENLANIFLQPGLNNDIYDWETNIYGSEWGSDAQSVDSNLIAQSDIIDILVYNMNNTGLAGYFSPKDNFKKSYISASNEKIMFYINSKLLATNKEETYTTLGHEFQHMIHFYRRTVLKDISDDTWFDEMMSETTEDLLATKIGYHGPRGVNPNDGSAGEAGNTDGRYPNFNAHNTLALTNWNNQVADYSKVSAFGTYLLRNFGGPALLHKLMDSNSYDKDALLETTGQSSLTSLVNQWGCAVILSDQTNLPQESKLRYNIGDFFVTTYNQISYSLGSINFFNYNPQPQFRNSAILNRNANLYTKIGDNLQGEVDITIDASKGATVSIIAK